MSIIFAALISFCGMMLIIHHLSAHWMRRLVGYKGWIDLMLHGTIIYLFFGTSTLGLLQAEAAGIMFSIYLRVYRKLFGYELWNIKRFRWERWRGALTRIAT
jgi:hypothetical protein